MIERVLLAWSSHWPIRPAWADQSVARDQVMQGGYGRSRRRQEAGKNGVVEDEEENE